MVLESAHIDPKPSIHVGFTVVGNGVDGVGQQATQIGPEPAWMLASAVGHSLWLGVQIPRFSIGISEFITMYPEGRCNLNPNLP